jgi:hypothetical protein
VGGIFAAGQNVLDVFFGIYDGDDFDERILQIR